MRRSLVVLALLVFLRVSPGDGQRPTDHGTAVIVVGQEATLPIPSLQGGKANQDVADLLFLRLLRLGPGLVTAGDRGFTPELARFHRRDSLTLVFDLDQRARWHDGVPVTAGDVVFAFTRARDRKIDPQRAVLLRNVKSVSAVGDYRVEISFTKVYGEQLYDAVWHVQPLPAHLLDTIPAERVGTSAYARAPIGNGPYRWVRRESGRLLELAAVPGFFLGEPRVDRVVFLLARDPEAQLNLILDGTGDALENITPISNVRRVAARDDYRVIAVPTFTVGYLLFNQRAYGNRLIPHPILSDVEVRRALAMAMDRQQMIRATFGDYGAVAEGPVAQLHWIRDPTQRASRYDPSEASQLLARRGWRDTDADGILDRNGERLSLRLNFPGTSAVRALLAAQAQEYLRQIGVQIELVRLDGPVWYERRTKGEFDIDFSSATMDPSPSGLVQSWSCAGRGGSNVGQYCNPTVDSLLEEAIADRRNPRRRWQDVIRTINVDTPAIFLYAPASAAAVHRRYGNVVIQPESWWSSLWRWGVTPGRQLPRDMSSPPP